MRAVQCFLTRREDPSERSDEFVLVLILDIEAMESLVERRTFAVRVTLPPEAGPAEPIVFVLYVADAADPETWERAVDEAIGLYPDESQFIPLKVREPELDRLLDRYVQGCYINKSCTRMIGWSKLRRVSVAFGKDAREETQIIDAVTARGRRGC